MRRVASLCCVLLAAASLLAACYSERLALEIDQEAYCGDTCDFAVRCKDAEHDACLDACTERFIVADCALDRYLAAPLERYGECIGALECDGKEDDCLIPYLERDLLAEECAEWAANCPFEADRTLCKMVPFMTDELRTELRRCFRNQCQIQEDYDYCAAIAFSCE